MNLSNVKLGTWSGLSLLSYASGIGIGMYGRNRIKFSSDFTYNKYHAGVYNILLCGMGFMLAAKRKNPMLYGAFLISSIANLSGPGLYEGWLDIHNEPITFDTSLQRKIGFYSLVIGMGLLWKF